MRYLVLILLLLQGVFLSANSSIEELKVKDVEVPMIYEKDRNLPIVTMQLIFKASGYVEDGELWGLSRVSSQILNEGSLKRGSVGFAQALEDRAIHLSVSGGAETFVVEISSLKEQFSKAIELAKELLSQPNLTEKSFEKVKLLTVASIKRKESDFDYIARSNLNSLLYKDTPLGHPRLGTLDSIKKIELKDVKEFLAKHLVLNRSLVLIGGDLSVNEAKLYSKDILEVLDKGEFGKVGFYEPKAKNEKVSTKKDTKQAYIYFGAPYHMKVNDPDAYKSKVATFILGAGGFGSRLMEEIRVKRGLAYSAYARENLAKSHSDFRGYLQTKLESQDEAIKIVKEVIANFVKDGVTKEELAQAKKFLLGSEPLRNETLSQRLNRAFMEYYNGFKLGYFKEQLKKIDSLKLDELNSFIKKHSEINSLSFSIVTK